MEKIFRPRERPQTRGRQISVFSAPVKERQQYRAKKVPELKGILLFPEMTAIAGPQRLPELRVVGAESLPAIPGSIVKNENAFQPVAGRPSVLFFKNISKLDRSPDENFFLGTVK
ncbi:MAG: hypothetical protein JXB25_07270 [Deltaproteobacteria bacterium]|nr:hypothetical protein [Deltaproteobacteria bacterium]